MAELKKEREERSWRKTEGKTKREIELDNLKESDESEYKSGFGKFDLDLVLVFNVRLLVFCLWTVLPDLTLATNVFLCRQWTAPLPTAKDPRGTKGGDPSFLGRIRLVRIFSDDKNSIVVETEGAREGEWETGEGEVEMGEDDDEEGDEDDEVEEE